MTTEYRSTAQDTAGNRAERQGRGHSPMRQRGAKQHRNTGGHENGPSKNQGQAFFRRDTFLFGPAQKFRTSCPEFLKSPHESLAKLARLFSSNFIPIWDEVLIREMQSNLYEKVSPTWRDFFDGNVSQVGTPSSWLGLEIPDNLSGIS